MRPESVLRGGRYKATSTSTWFPAALATGYNQGLSLLTLHVGL